MALNPDPKRKPTDRPGESFTAWEDGHRVSAESPEVSWYLEPDGRWKLDPISNSVTINPDYFDAAVAASWGLGPDAIAGMFEGMGKGGGNMATMMISGAGGEISATTKALKAQIVADRNAWCVRNKIPIPGGPAAPAARPSFRDWLVQSFGNPEKFFDFKR